MTKKYPFLSTHLFVKLYDERDSPQVISNCWKRIEVRVGPSPPDGLSIPAFPIYAETAGHIRESVRWLNWMYGGILRPEDVYRSIEQQSAVYFNLIQQNALISKPISTANMVCYFIIISRQHSNVIIFCEKFLLHLKKWILIVQYFLKRWYFLRLLIKQLIKSRWFFYAFPLSGLDGNL